MSPAPGQPEPTICVTCDNLADNKGRHPSRWTCLKFPRLEGFGFVTEDTWDRFDPHMYCVGINGGDCPLWEPLKEEPEPKET